MFQDPKCFPPSVPDPGESAMPRAPEPKLDPTPEPTPAPTHITDAVPRLPDPTPTHVTNAKPWLPDPKLLNVKGKTPRPKPPAEGKLAKAKAELLRRANDFAEQPAFDLGFILRR